LDATSKQRKHVRRERGEALRCAVVVREHEQLPSGDAPRKLVRDRCHRCRYRDDALDVGLEARREDRMPTHRRSHEGDLASATFAPSRAFAARRSAIGDHGAGGREVVGLAARAVVAAQVQRKRWDATRDELLRDFAPAAGVPA
jgi:hypothetical protein